MKVAHLSSYYVVKFLLFHRADLQYRNRVNKKCVNCHMDPWIESGIGLIKCFHKSLWKGIHQVA